MTRTNHRSMTCLTLCASVAFIGLAGTLGGCDTKTESSKSTSTKTQQTPEGTKKTTETTEKKTETTPKNPN
jgi:hypothetical protein